MTINGMPVWTIAFRSMLAFFCVVCVPLYSWSGVTNHDAPVYFDLDGCIAALSQDHKGDSPAVTGDKALRLVSWNIEKGKNEGWLEELKKVAVGSDFVFLQEAIFIDEMKQPSNKEIFWSFSPGYKTERYSSGVMTLSRAKPDLVCSLASKEPWLRTPKMISVVRLPDTPAGGGLLLINVHAVNFTLGLSAYRAQLKIIETLLSAYTYPVVVAGDMNTWSEARESELKTLAQEHGLVPVTFDPDWRTQKFGRPLDHILIRGLLVEHSEVVSTATSDHNLLKATISGDKGQ
ncbi:Uncharacterized conserved protein YafD, endonuclease/exonuclease/phosphatase (EEP) superfamily [Alteromonadaceae bacterium Bs31]|nr:Uncharacterized conserved protein YafD, endonuclease/exonuclease/phosphatase (EEP) superfamily [Alteromonadaceae bacterium Bs31]